MYTIRVYILVIFERSGLEQRGFVFSTFFLFSFHEWFITIQICIGIYPDVTENIFMEFTDESLVLPCHPRHSRLPQQVLFDTQHLDHVLVAHH